MEDNKTKRDCFEDLETITLLHLVYKLLVKTLEVHTMGVCFCFWLPPFSSPYYGCMFILLAATLYNLSAD